MSGNPRTEPFSPCLKVSFAIYEELHVKKTVGGVTTKYLVDTLNPTGYPQVVYESIQGPGSNSETRNYTYGLERISQYRTLSNSTTQTSYYIYDGHGSTRALTDSTGSVTDTYDYDAFGNEIHVTGATPNEFLFAGEQYDSDLHLYYNRARYLNVSTGRFWTRDAFDGDPQSPASLHKYVYVADDPANKTDPSGYDFDIASTLAAVAIGVTLGTIGVLSLKDLIDRPTYQVIYEKVTRDPYIGHFKDFEVQINAPNAGVRFTVVQWLRGSYKFNGRTARLYHQNDSEYPFDFPDWAIDSFTNLAEYPGIPGATSLKKEQNDILFYDAPGAHVANGSPLPPGTYEADLDFQINVYEGSVSNDVSWFRSIGDPAPVLRINWDFHDVFQVTYP
jgi:RHS repeat-associated protein